MYIEQIHLHTLSGRNIYTIPRVHSSTDPFILYSLTNSYTQTNAWTDILQRLVPFVLCLKRVFISRNNNSDNTAYNICICKLVCIQVYFIGRQNIQPPPLTPTGVFISIRICLLLRLHVGMCVFLYCMRLSLVQTFID